VPQSLQSEVDKIAEIKALYPQLTEEESRRELDLY
jgi:hypothetical protein